MNDPIYSMPLTGDVVEQEIQLSPRGMIGNLNIPENARGLVVFAHGSGSGRLSPRNIAVARGLNQRRFATLLFDLLTPEEEAIRANVFDIALLAERLVSAVDWIDGHSPAVNLPLGLFGASTGAAAALVAAAQLAPRVGAVVSRGGRPDLAGDALERVAAPTLLIVGGVDDVVLQLNEEALARMNDASRLEIVPGASHLFPEPGALEAVMGLAAAWFEQHLSSARM